MVLEVKNVNYAYKSQKGKEILKKGEKKSGKRQANTNGIFVS